MSKYRLALATPYRYDRSFPSREAPMTRRSFMNVSAALRSFPALAAIVLLAPTSDASAQQAAAIAYPPGFDAPMPLHPTLGNYKRKITTSSSEAQAYFDQGVRLIYAFNLQEAQRSFREAE